MPECRPAVRPLAARAGFPSEPCSRVSDLARARRPACVAVLSGRRCVPAGPTRGRRSSGFAWSRWHRQRTGLPRLRRRNWTRPQRRRRSRRHSATRTTTAPTIARTPGSARNEDGDRRLTRAIVCPTPFVNSIADDDGDHASGNGHCLPSSWPAFATVPRADAPAPGWTTVGNCEVREPAEAAIRVGNGDAIPDDRRPPASAGSRCSRSSPSTRSSDADAPSGPAQMFQPSARCGVACELLRDGNGPKLALVDDNSSATRRPTRRSTPTRMSVQPKMRDGLAYDCDDGNVTLTGTPATSRRCPGGRRAHAQRVGARRLGARHRGD